MGLRDWWHSFKPVSGPTNQEVSFGARVYIQQDDPRIAEARKAATAHARTGDYAAAAADLERVHALITSDGSPADCASEIRRAKYLQKAGRGEEAWQLLRILLELHQSDPWSLVDLLDAMRLHLQRENQAMKAIPYGVAMRLAQVKLYRDWRCEAEAANAGPVQSYGDKELERLIRENQKRDIELCDRWLTQLTGVRELIALVAPLCKKAGAPEQADDLVAQLQAKILLATDPVDYLKAEGVS